MVKKDSPICDWCRDAVGTEPGYRGPLRFWFCKPCHARGVELTKAYLRNNPRRRRRVF